MGEMIRTAEFLILPPMSPGALQKLQRLFLIVDYTTGRLGESIANLDLQTLTTMTSLKHMHIGVVLEMHLLEMYPHAHKIKHALLGELLCRLRGLLRAEVQLQVCLAPESAEEELALSPAREEQRQRGFFSEEN
jgi:hypothetical protein